MNLNPIIKVPVAELKNNLVGLGKVIHRGSTLPILSMIHVERDRAGWVHLTATDLDSFATLRLEAPGQHGDPAKCLVPFAELQKLAKTCPGDEVLELEVFSADKLIVRHRIGSHPVEQVVTTDPVQEFPPVPPFEAASASLDEASKTTILQAMECASEDETRVILNGAYLDVSRSESHYIVATDGRHLFASNSIRLPLAASTIVPDHRFLSWNGFVKDGQWKLSVKDAKKDEHPYLKVESRRWTFIAKQIEGTYPNWRQITGEVQNPTGTIEVSDAAAEEMARIVPRLPGDDLQNHTLGLYSVSGRLWLRGWNKDDERATEVEVSGVKISGDPATVYVNREYLLKAVAFGLRQIVVQEPLMPVRFHDGGSRQMIVMPVRVDAYPGTKASSPASMPVSPIKPAASSIDAVPDKSIHPDPNPNQEESTQAPMQNPTSTNTTNSNHNNNGNGHQPVAVATETANAPTVEKSPVEQALEQIEFIKGSLRGVMTGLNATADTLRQVQRDRRSSEREIRSVRDMLKTLQTVRL